jgi:hypothetical protein
VAAPWVAIPLFNLLRIGDRPFWGSGRPRGHGRPSQKVGGEAQTPKMAPPFRRASRAPGAPETLAKGRGRSPPPFGRASGAPGAAQTSKMASLKNEIYLPQYCQILPNKDSDRAACGSKLCASRSELKTEPILRKGSCRYRCSQES